MARSHLSSTTIVRRSAPSGSLRRRAVAHTVLALVILTACGIGLAPQPHASASTVPSTIALMSETPWVRTTAGTHLKVAIRSDLAPSRLGLVVTLYSQVTERGYFEETLSGDMQDFTVLTSSPVMPLDQKGLLGPGGIASIDLPVAPPSVPGKAPRSPRNGTILNIPCSGTCAGVYPLQVSLEDRETYTPLDSFMTYLVLVPKQVTSPLRFSFVAPLGSRPALAPSGRPDLSPADETGVELMGDDLSAYPTVPVTVALYPQLAGALEDAAAERVKPAHAPSRLAPGAAGAMRALSALRRLVRLTNVEVTGETYARVDLSAMAVSRLRGSAERQFGAGRAALRALGVNTAGAPYASSLPIGPRGLALVKSAGMTRLVVPSDSVSAVPTSWVYPVWAPFLVRGTGEEVDASDYYLEQHLESSADPVLRADQLLADLAVLYFVEQPPGNRGVSLLAPSDWHPTQRFLSTLLVGLSSSPVVRPVTLSGLFRQVVAGADEIPPGDAISPLLYRSVVDGHIPPGDLLPRSALRSARDDLGALARVLRRTPSALSAADHTVLVGESTGLSRKRRLAYLSAPAAALAREARFVSLPRKRTITITSLSAKIPVSVSSRAPTLLDVDLRLSGCPPPFTDPDCHGAITFDHHARFTRTLQLRPGNHTIEVRVSARSSGDFYFYLELTSPKGGVVLTKSRILIRSTAISGVAIVLTAVAGAFLIVWWLRSAFRRRRGRHARGARTPVGTDEAILAR